MLRLRRPSENTQNIHRSAAVSYSVVFSLPLIHISFEQLISISQSWIFVFFRIDWIEKNE